MLVESDSYPGVLCWGFHTFHSFSPQTALLSMGSLGVTITHVTLEGTLLPASFLRWLLLKAFGWGRWEQFPRH